MTPFIPDTEVLFDAVQEFAWNTLTERFEPPFRIRKRDPELQRKIDQRLEYALNSGGQAHLSQTDRCTALDVLKAFRRLVKHSSDEYAVVALSTPSESEHFLSIFASKGTPTRVTIPQAAHRQIQIRRNQGLATRALYVHNHPRGILHDIFGVDSFGPSTADRGILTHEYRRWLDTQGLIQSDFSLIEGRYFRKFVVPSASDSSNFIQQFLAAQ